MRESVKRKIALEIAKSNLQCMTQEKHEDMDYAISSFAGNCYDTAIENGHGERVAILAHSYFLSIAQKHLDSLPNQL